MEIPGPPYQVGSNGASVKRMARERSSSVVGLELPLPSHSEARMLPSFEAVCRLGEDLLSLEQHPEEPLAEGLLEAGEVEILHGEEDAVGTKEAQRADCMRVGMGDQEVPEGLRRDDHGGDSLLLPREQRRMGAQVVAGGGIGDAAELAVERAVEEERLPESDGDGEDELPVGDDGKHFFNHALGPL